MAKAGRIATTGVAAARRSRRWILACYRRGVMRALVILGCLVASSLARADAPVEQDFVLYKFQNRIGAEQSIDDGREIRTVFTFTDRWSPVSLASTPPSTGPPSRETAPS